MREEVLMANTKSGQKRRRTQIRHRQKRREKRRKLAQKLGVTIDEISAMMERGEVKKV
jgi:DNA-binding Xre family transcriptional regulator